MEKSKRNERIAALREALVGRILVLDGGLGTMIQGAGLGEADFSYRDMSLSMYG